ncbi:MAG: hypothetical protein L6R36_006836 [Xanthoria steineri]|nr:MAG: hypothetical protein L6R36_006836 [Xanthoria steineri]
MSSQGHQSSPVELEHNTATEDDSSDGEEPVESLVTGRAKRVTAGTRMSNLLEKEGDDELELLFAEDEQDEDNEFEADHQEDASDLQLDSASSDDEQGPAQDDDDFEGEKELQRQTRVERQKKRKAQDAFMKPGAMKKRIKLPSRPDAPSPASFPSTPAPKRKKKSERVSWLPTPEEGPVRASSRKQTVQNKEITNIRLVASEKRRRQQLRVMEEAAKRKEASKPKAMNQAQRMEEAARVERVNAKSLNRWETAEKKRVAEQKAKLEALHNRQLTGPVISWWSGVARWVNGKLKQVGWKSVKEAEAEGNLQASQADDHMEVPPASESVQKPVDGDFILQDTNDGRLGHPLSNPAGEVEVGDGANTSEALLAPPTEPEGFLDGIHYYASLPELSGFSSAHDNPGSLSHDTVIPERPAPGMSSMVVPAPASAPAASRAPPPGPPPVELSGRNVVILEDIDANTQRLPDLQNYVLVKKRQGKLLKAGREQCAITDQPAKYRDPRTGLPYTDSYAYKEIQKLANGGSCWSSLLGCYVGPTSGVARGVPERFATNRPALEASK